MKKFTVSLRAYSICHSGFSGSPGPRSDGESIARPAQQSFPFRVKARSQRKFDFVDRVDKVIWLLYRDLAARNVSTPLNLFTVTKLTYHLIDQSLGPSLYSSVQPP